LGSFSNNAAEAGHVVHEGKLRKGCFVRLKEYQTNNAKGKRYVSNTIAERGEAHSWIVSS